MKQQAVHIEQADQASTFLPHSTYEKGDHMAIHRTRERVIAVANLKGGVGKTTTVLNMAGFAGQMGKRVLAVDTDPQGSLTRVALPDDGPTTSLSDAFARRAQSLDGVRCPSRFLGVCQGRLTFDPDRRWFLTHLRQSHVTQLTGSCCPQPPTGFDPPRSLSVPPYRPPCVHASDNCGH